MAGNDIHITSGAGRGEATARQLMRAPDGGLPAFNTQNYKYKRTPVQRVLVKASGTYALVNKKQFDPELHELAPEGEDAPAAPPEQPATTRRKALKPQFGEHSRDELLTMTIDGLKALPEYEALEQPEMNTTKKSIVEAILHVRKA